MGTKHKDAKDIHKFAYVSDVDPGAIGADKGWVDMSKMPPQFKVRNKNNDGWILIGGDLAEMLDILSAQISNLTTQLGTKANKTNQINGYELANPSIQLDASDIGLGAVNNTSDEAKPVSTPQAAALSGKQPVIVENQFGKLLTLNTNAEAQYEILVESKLCSIDNLSATKDCLVQIYNNENFNEPALVIERELTGDAESVIASPVLVKTTMNKVYVSVINRGTSGEMIVTVKFTPIAL